MASLTSRERVNRLFARQDHDRVPRHDTFWDETVARWQAEGLVGGREAVLEQLGSDLHFVARADPLPYPGQRLVVRDEGETQIVRDPHGALLRCWRQRTGTPEHLGWECSSPEIWRQRLQPAMLAHGIQVDLPAAAQAYAEGRRQGKWCYFTCIEAFEFTRRTLGDVVALTAMIEQPDWIREISSFHTDRVLAELEAVVARGIVPDGLWVFGDMAYNRSTVCSPATYRELVWPDHRRLATWAHARGLKVIYHTDGNVHRALDLYLEAGFDCLQPLEAKAGMDVRTLAPAYGDRLAFFGNIDAVVLATNEPDAVEAELRSKLAAGMARRCYLYHSDHSVPPGVAWTTYQHLIRLLDHYGRYA